MSASVPTSIAVSSSCDWKGVPYWHVWVPSVLVSTN